MDCHRKLIRLKGFDYSQNGYYFVTICVFNKLELFWNIDNKRADTSVRPYRNINDIGSMVDFWLREISNHFKNVMLDEYVIMSDHIHFILIIKNVGIDRCVDPYEKKKKIGDMVQWFKTMSTNEYIRNVKENDWPRFDKRLWQRNYFERIIRGEEEYLRIKGYIKNNPKTWDRIRNNF